MSKEAMKLALEALENMAEDLGRSPSDIKAITAIREALAEQPAQQEPVAWMADVRKVRDALDPEDWCGDERMIDVLDRALAQKPCCLNMAAGTSCLADPRPNCPLLSAAPQPAQRTWVGLSDGEITDIWAEASPYYHEDDFARAIEAKLKEKNA